MLIPEKHSPPYKHTRTHCSCLFHLEQPCMWCHGTEKRRIFTGGWDGSYVSHPLAHWPWLLPKLSSSKLIYHNPMTISPKAIIYILLFISIYHMNYVPLHSLKAHNWSMKPLLFQLYILGNIIQNRYNMHVRFPFQFTFSPNIQPST